MNYLKEIFGARELLTNLTMREVRGKYKRTVLGQLWSLVNPLALMLIYTFVFKFVIKVQPDAGSPSGLNVFAIWLLCGLLPWTFLATVINQGAGSLVENANLIQKVSFTRIVLPLAVVGSAGYNWMFEMGVLVIALTVVGGFVIPWIPLVLVAMVLLALFAAGLALMLSIANVHFRDTQYFISIALQMWMYLTPIIYPATLVDTKSVELGGLAGTRITVADIFHLNPMEHIVNLFRTLLYDNRMPDLSDWVWSFSAAAVSIVLGLIVFQRHARGLAEAL
ncbi:ABC transporter permease [Demequina lutea]|uniref:Transport permease protein n=1 Tax=Demequina lutea TaxID=431489 RepID=A0A7Z0CL18_9MICO|nr:ABC transporter permease [Demequina lutea]NYI42463.1 ABC-2 type transport system permease protein [Demequina lutea]